jgi:hypothetical protein
MSYEIHFRSIETEPDRLATMMTIIPPLGTQAIKGLYRQLADEKDSPQSAVNVTNISHEDLGSTHLVFTAVKSERLRDSYAAARYVGGLIGPDGADAVAYRHVLDNFGAHDIASGDTHECVVEQ